MPKARAKTKGVPTPPAERRRTVPESRTLKVAERPSTSAAPEGVVIPSSSGLSCDVGEVSSEVQPGISSLEASGDAYEDDIYSSLSGIISHVGEVTTEDPLMEDPESGLFGHLGRDIASESRPVNLTERPSTSAVSIKDVVIHSSSELSSRNTVSKVKSLISKFESQCLNQKGPSSDVREISREDPRMEDPQQETSIVSNLKVSKVKSLISKFESQCLNQKGPSSDVREISREDPRMEDPQQETSIVSNLKARDAYEDDINPSSSGLSIDGEEVPTMDDRWMTKYLWWASSDTDSSEDGGTSPGSNIDHQQQQSHGTNVQPPKEVAQDSEDVQSHLIWLRNCRSIIEDRLSYLETEDWGTSPVSNSDHQQQQSHGTNVQPPEEVAQDSEDVQSLIRLRNTDVQKCDLL